MSAQPPVLRGAAAIGAHLGVTPAMADHLHRQRLMPTFRVVGDTAPCALAAGLDEWRRLGTSDLLLIGGGA